MMNRLGCERELPYQWSKGAEASVEEQVVTWLVWSTWEA